MTGLSTYESHSGLRGLVILRESAWGGHIILSNGCSTLQFSLCFRIERTDINCHTCGGQTRNQTIVGLCPRHDTFLIRMPSTLQLFGFECFVCFVCSVAMSVDRADSVLPACSIGNSSRFRFPPTGVLCDAEAAKSRCSEASL